MKKLLFLLVFIGFTVASYAQTTVSGTVVDKEDGNPLPGVGVMIKGTDKGTATDFDGNFSIPNVSSGSVLEITFLGYKRQEITIDNQTQLNIFLEVDAQQLDEVLVTALDIERDKASLGYSVSQVDAVEFDVAKENNVINSLTGKVSGLQITQANTGVDGSSRILLRGVTTIEGSNRPLVVIDGIPMFSDAGGAGSGGGIDRGDELSDVNPDDVESITVLKGAGAAAAYGSLGMHGVILITTKSGQAKKGIGISFNSSYMVTETMLTPDFQNEYGTGAFDQFAPVGPGGRPVLDYPFSWSWGPKMEGQAYTNWLGEQDTFTPQGHPYDDFYQSGYSFINSIAFDGSSDKGSFRLSFTNQDSEGIIPNNTIRKNTINLRASSKLTDNFKIDGKVTYVNSTVKNRPQLAEGSSNSALQLSLMPRDIRLNDVRNNIEDADGNEIKWNLDKTFNNPYWAQKYIYNEDDKDRIQGMISAKLDISDKFYITGKSGLDLVMTDWVEHGARGAEAVSNGLGNYNNQVDKSSIWNSDILATYNTDISGFNITASIGSNYRKEFSKHTRVWGNDSKVPHFYNISNYKNTFNSNNKYEKAVYSFYALGQFSYGGYLYFDATVRNDNSSALPKGNDSYWYYSGNASLLFSKLFGITSETFNLGKLRASYSRVGNDTNPYRTQYVYNIDQTPTLNYTVASIPSTLPSVDLKPEITDSWEVGTELGFFNNRIALDFTYYEALSKDQIMAVPISGTTGYSNKVINAGSIENKGLEIQLNTIPIETDNFNWQFDVTLTKSNSKVKELSESLESITLNSLQAVSVEAREGEEFGTIYGYDFLRDNFGRKLITNEGLAQRGERKAFGTMNPDFYGGIANNFRYKNWSLRSLVSYQKGGEFYSWGRGYRMFFGTDKRSLPGRDTGVIEEGINEHTGFDNDVVTTAMLKQYTDIFVNQVATDLILDATNVKLKELILTYKFPRRYLDKSFIQGLSISAIGRDLFFIYNAAGDVDPYAAYNSSPTATALEHASLPSTRSYGLNVKIDF